MLAAMDPIANPGRLPDRLITFWTIHPAPGAATVCWYRRSPDPL